MRLCSKCLECEKFSECKDEDRCIYDPEFTRRDVSWKEFNDKDAILDNVEFGDIILALHHEKEINKATLLSVAKRELEIREQDFWYLLHLNEEEIMERAKEGRE